MPLTSSRIEWTSSDPWEGAVHGAQRFSGVVVWLPNRWAGGMGLLRATRASMSPRQPLVVVTSRPPTPREWFRCLEVCAEFVDTAVERDWLWVVEGLLTGHLRGVSLLHDFCKACRLSPSESLAVFLACAGLSKAEGHDLLGCSPRTLETYWRRIFLKLGIHSTAGVVAAALRFSAQRYSR